VGHKGAPLLWCPHPLRSAELEFPPDRGRGWSSLSVAVNVKNVRTSDRRDRPGPGLRTHAATERICTSKPAQRSTSTSTTSPFLSDRIGPVRAEPSNQGVSRARSNNHGPTSRPASWCHPGYRHQSPATSRPTQHKLHHLGRRPARPPSLGVTKFPTEQIDALDAGAKRGSCELQRCGDTLGIGNLDVKRSKSSKEIAACPFDWTPPTDDTTRANAPL
jgi:hypothetical protein